MPRQLIIHIHARNISQSFPLDLLKFYTFLSFPTILRFYFKDRKHEVNDVSRMWGQSLARYSRLCKSTGAIEIFLAYRSCRASRYSRAQNLENYSTISGFGSEVSRPSQVSTLFSSVYILKGIEYVFSSLCVHNTLLLLQISFTRTTDNFLRLEGIELRKP